MKKYDDRNKLIHLHTISKALKFTGDAQPEIKEHIIHFKHNSSACSKTYLFQLRHPEYREFVVRYKQEFVVSEKHSLNSAERSHAIHKSLRSLSPGYCRILPIRAHILASCLCAARSHVSLACDAHQSVKKRWAANVSWCVSIEDRPLGPQLSTPQSHGEPIRDEIRLWLAKGHESDWPSVLSLAGVIFYIWTGAARAKNVLPPMCFQCECSWYTTHLSFPLSCSTVRGDTTLVCKAYYTAVHIDGASH